VWVFTRNQQYDSTATYFDTILGLTMVRVEFKKNQSSINQSINHPRADQNELYHCIRRARCPIAPPSKLHHVPCSPLTMSHTVIITHVNAFILPSLATILEQKLVQTSALKYLRRKQAFKRERTGAVV